MFGIAASKNTESSQPNVHCSVRINVYSRIQLIWGQERMEGEEEKGGGWGGGNKVQEGEKRENVITQPTEC